MAPFETDFTVMCSLLRSRHRMEKLYGLDPGLDGTYSFRKCDHIHRAPSHGSELSLVMVKHLALQEQN